MPRWRKQGDPAAPGHDITSKDVRKRKGHDRTYGKQDDMLDRPGVIVEPDVRKKVSDYLNTMGLREWVREILLTMNK